VKTSFELDTAPNGYGFGRDYFLVLTDGERMKRYWLGQDAKVFSRVLGIPMREAVEYYSQKAQSENFDDVKPFIAADIIRSLRNITDSQWEVTDEDVKALMTAEAWELCCQ
jgi:hypothetical protein